MRCMIFSDVHGNLPAFQAVKKHSGNEHFDMKICLGDSVGYYPFHNEVLKELRDFADVILPGNHDVVIYEMARRIRDDNRGKPSHKENMFRPAAKEAASWIANNLTEESFSMLEGIVKNRLSDRFSLRERNLLFTHSTPDHPEGMDYITDATDAHKHFFAYQEFRNVVAFVGHTHVPQFYAEPEANLSYNPPLGGRIRITERLGEKGPDDVLVLTPDELVKPADQAEISDTLKDWKDAHEGLMDKLTVMHNNPFRPVEIKLNTSAYARSLAVVPGLGQPRDGLNLTGYATYDTDTKELCFVRILYDIKPVLEKSMQLEAFAQQAHRLRHGI